MAATGAMPNDMDVRDYSKILIELVETAGGTATVKVEGCLPDVAPTWGSAASDTNKLTFVGFKNMDARTVVGGNTGQGLTANQCQIIEVDTSLIGKINLNITAIAAGGVTARAWGVAEM